MTDLDPKDSVRKEQFGKTENTDLPKNDESTDDLSANEVKSSDEIQTSSEESNNGLDLISDETQPVNELVDESLPDSDNEGPKVAKQTTEEPVVENPEPDKTAAIDTDSVKDKPTEEVDSKNIEPTSESTDKPEKELPELSKIDYSSLSKEKLVDLFSQYLSDYSANKIKDHVEAIKASFYKKLNEEIEEVKKKFLEEGGLVEDFRHEETPLELKIKELLNTFREKRNEIVKSQEAKKEANLKTKYEIIESIKELINSQESLNKTFNDFRTLQEKWHEVGPIPQKSVKEIWENYHYHVEAFYDFIKINKELRDLDFKKNLDAKMALCEKSEELLLETSVVEAFRKLQTLHDQWREIGPVPSEKRAEIWERFKEATTKINHRHQEYFVNLKEEQKQNLQEKTALCEKAEELSAAEHKSAKEWEVTSKEMVELQKVWKTIGFAPKKYNTKIYERFRAACDLFFNKKREHFSQNKEEQENNLQLKTELCIQAEALQDSTDWKKTTDDLIKIQKRWKAIGPVPIKQSDKIWKRFRAACDTFFNSKSKYFENIDSVYEENLKLKEALIEEIEKFELSEDIEDNLNKLNIFQRKWSDIGYVPIKQKEDIQENYRDAINKKFDELKLDDNKKSILKFRSRIESIAEKPNADRRLDMEREKCYTKLKQLENDITLWENNIGFFSNSKNAASMISDVENKISTAKEKIKSLKDKMAIIDKFSR